MDRSYGSKFPELDLRDLFAPLFLFELSFQSVANLNFARRDGISLPGGKIAGTLLTAPLHLRFNFYAMLIPLLPQAALLCLSSNFKSKTERRVLLTFHMSVLCNKRWMKYICVAELTATQGKTCLNQPLGDNRCDLTVAENKNKSNLEPQ